MNYKSRANLVRALGLVQGILHIKEMENFDKAGLASGLEEIEKLLTETLEIENDR